MKSTLIMLLCIAAMAAAGSSAWAGPAVSNVRANQRPSSTLVDIYYDLSGGTTTMTASVVFSSNNGTSWTFQPTSANLTGDIGVGVKNGTNRHIVWDAGNDQAGVYWPQARAKVRVANAATFLLPGNVPLEMMLIPSGSFIMGSDDFGWGNYDEVPTHTVTLNYSFYMGKYEITQAQWQAVMGNNPSFFTGDPKRPVEKVTWADCQTFITQLNTLGLGTFRLPSEAEFEYAARAGSTTRWFHGSDEAQVGDYAWYEANSGNQTHPVGQKLPNPFGLYDISGNVFELCQDWYNGSYTGAPTDGSAWESAGIGGSRVMRGGVWDNNTGLCRPVARAYATGSYNSVGLRLVRTQ